MKYLKLFERHNIESWYKIDRDVGSHINHIDWKCLDKNQIKMVVDAGEGVIRQTEYIHDDRTLGVLSRTQSEISTFFKLDTHSVNISQSDDEWFMVVIYSHNFYYRYVGYTCIYFMCDQMDGLIDCINHLLDVRKSYLLTQ